MKENMKVSDLPMGTQTVILLIRKGKERRIVRGRVIKKNEKCFVAWYWPIESFGPGTQVLWYQKGVKEIK